MPDRCEPNDKKSKVCPPYKVGDEVIVIGTLSITSSHGERNTDGLLVYKAMKNLTRNWATGGTIAIPQVAAAAKKALPASLGVKKLAAHVRPVVAAAAKRESTAHLTAGNKALGQKIVPDAIGEYEAAVKAWPDNHLAWYGLGAAQALQGKWSDAAIAFENAVQRVPDSAMYQMWIGVAKYEAARATNAAAPDDAWQHLDAALQLEPNLWRAHYYLGKLARERGEAKVAAEHLTKALMANPREYGPYIALAEIYRKWDYTDEAIKVAAQGSSNVPGANEVSDVWLELGMAYDDKRMTDQAIDAYSKALESKKDNARALFQRGQAYFRKGDFASARRDLEAFAKSGSQSEFAKQVASRMLMDIDAKAHQH
jgi:tetratricopeptide (TPR) repeat protein